MPPQSPNAALPTPMLPNGVGTDTAGADGQELVKAKPSRDGTKLAAGCLMHRLCGGAGLVDSPPYRWVRCGGLSAAERVDAGHLIRRKPEAEQVNVGPHPVVLR